MRRRALPTRKKRGFANSYEQRNMSSPITTSQVSRAQARPVQVGHRDAAGSTLINHWQRGVRSIASRWYAVTHFFGALAALGLVLAAMRFFSPLGPSPE